jgi:hypothetical protein
MQIAFDLLRWFSQRILSLKRWAWKLQTLTIRLWNYDWTSKAKELTALNWVKNLRK